MLLKTRAMIFFKQYLLQVCYCYYDWQIEQNCLKLKQLSTMKRCIYNDGYGSTLKFLIS